MEDARSPRGDDGLSGRRGRPGWGLGGGFLLLLLIGCASGEPGRYAVERLTFEGTNRLDARALEACLITRQRESFDLRLGLGQPRCGLPPFDRSAPTLRLWRWPWTEWPTFNHAVFDRDLERVLRWYRARGYYQAALSGVHYDPPEAAHPGFRGPCEPRDEDCTVSILVTIAERDPTLARSVDLQGLDVLEPRIQELIAAEVQVEVGAPIDEAHYDGDLQRIQGRLRALGYANALVEGQVEVDTGSQEARIVYRITPGAPHRFGRLTVSGHGELPEHVIAAAAALPVGSTYDPEVIDEIHTEVFALGAFSAVEVRETLVEDEARVDVEVFVTPLPKDALRLGVGVTSGALRRTETADLVSVPQWDAHVFTQYERRHVFGTLGRVSLDERPRLIFNREFPRVTEPRFGNTVSASLNQPGLLEARTDTFQRAGWDYGPEPFLGFRRSDLFVRVGARRGFWGRRLVLTLAAQQDRYIVLDDPENVTSDGSPLPTSYDYTFLEQELRLDLRDDRARTTRGFFMSLGATQAPRWAYSDWTALRVAPDLRAYVRLPFDIVWANRAAAAAFFITDASPELDLPSQRLGPHAYRLRGGGAYSNRGFLAGTLGVGLPGGIRRWEASTELRVPLGSSLVLAGFVDLGDVSDGAKFRFTHLNTSAGYGLRYYTVLGAIRLDVGHRVLAWQGWNAGASSAEDISTLPFTDLPGAVHLTIGDPF